MLRVLVYILIFTSILLRTAVAKEEVEGAEEKARAIIDRALDYLANTSSLTARTRVSMNQQFPGKPAQSREADSVVSFSRGQGFAILSGEPKGPEFSFFEGEARLFVPELGLVETKAASAEEALRDPLLGYDEKGRSQFFAQRFGASFLQGMLFHGQDAPWSLGLEDFRFIGEDEQEGERMNKVMFSMGLSHMGKMYTVPGTLWFGIGDHPVIKRFEIDMSPVAEDAVKRSPALFGLSLSISGSIDELRRGVALSSDDFAMDVPDGVPVEKALFKLVNKVQPPPSGIELVGNVAPELEFPLLDGSTFKLSEQKGKTVVLEFWATFCAPCIITMPVYLETVKNFEDQGVVLVGICLGEEKSHVASFLEKAGWDLTVALDPELSSQQIYRFRKIPHTVIVGADGKVKDISSQLNATFLRAELTYKLEEELGIR
ncbi:MAG: TlpA disulfide reductase family protein [Verrucomicrobiota bacterium]